MSSLYIREIRDNEEEYIIDGLVEYNLSKVPSKQEKNFLKINRVVEGEEGEIIGGIISCMYGWNCLYIDLLWVSESHRKEGIGTMLLNEVLNISKEKGCELVHLDTFDFQAKDFYLKHGFEVFGVLDGCPSGHKRYYMKKNMV